MMSADVDIQQQQQQQCASLTDYTDELLRRLTDATQYCTAAHCLADISTVHYSTANHFTTCSLSAYNSSTYSGA